MTLLVRDEADIVASNIEYHLSRGVDHVIVTDNGSLDGTRAIIESFVTTGRVTLIDELGDDYRQDVWVSRMAKTAWEFGADWVINSDADEVWWTDEQDLKTALERVPSNIGAMVVPRSNMLPLRRLEGHAFSEMVVRDLWSKNSLGEALQGKALHRAVPDVKVAPGNHSVDSDLLGELATASPFTVLHFPYRSYTQFARKIANGGAAVGRNAASPALSMGWRESYRQLLAGTLRAWYDALPHADDDDVSEREARAEVVRDTRLSAYLREVGRLAQ